MDLIERDVDLDQRHPWELARASFNLKLLEGLRQPTGPTNWLDIGSGDAWLAEQLRTSTPAEDRLVCWDINYSDEDLVRTTRGVELTAERPTGKFDVLLMLDVIEHVESDQDFLTDVVESCLSPDGIVVLSVPAYMSLFSNHDRFLKHYRRYSPREARDLISRCGLELVTEGGLFFSLLPVRALQLAVERRRKRGHEVSGIGAWNGGPLVTSLTSSILSLDGSLSSALARRKIYFPGLSYWAVCRRAGS